MTDAQRREIGGFDTPEFERQIPPPWLRGMDAEINKSYLA